MERWRENVRTSGSLISPRFLTSRKNQSSANKAFSKMLKLQLNNIVGQNATNLFRKNVPDLIELLKETIQTRKGIRNYTMEIAGSAGGHRNAARVEIPLENILGKPEDASGLGTFVRKILKDRE